MSLKIYQIYYQPGHISKLDPAFTPLDNSKFTGTEEIRKFREWTIFRDLDYYMDKSSPSNLCGFVSHKFNEKTHIKGQDFIKFIDNNPGNDVYFLEPQIINNPFFNIWIQGECYHNGIINLTNRIFELTGTKIDVSKISMPFCFFNAFAGNQKFWDYLILAINNILKAAELDPYVNKMLFMQNAGYKTDTTLSYFPFIVERMASTIMAINDLKVIGMPYYDPIFVYRSIQTTEKSQLEQYCEVLLKDGLLL